MAWILSEPESVPMSVPHENMLFGEALHLSRPKRPTEQNLIFAGRVVA